MPLYRLVLADDHPLLRDSIATYIEDHCQNQLKVVAQAGDGPSALAAVKKHNPDVVLLDIGMPGLDGIAALKEIKAHREAIVVLILSMYEDQGHVMEAIRAGADDYLFKRSANAATVVGQILRALDSEPPAPDLMHRRVFQALRGRSSPSDLSAGRLTGAELEVLKLVAHHGCSMKEAAQRLGGPEHRVSENTVRKHLEHVYQKLGARSQAHAVCIAIQQQIISSDDVRPDDRLPE